MFQKDGNFLSEDLLLEKIKELALIYKGTRNYHNFTTKVQFSQDASKRYIKNIDVELLQSDFQGVDNTKYVKFIIEGHGFLYHQIRKMLGLIIQIMNGYYKEEILDVFGKEKINIWLAPGEGLFLKEVSVLL